MKRLSLSIVFCLFSVVACGDETPELVADTLVFIPDGPVSDTAIDTSPEVLPDLTDVSEEGETATRFDVAEVDTDSALDSSDASVGPTPDTSPDVFDTSVDTSTSSDTSSAEDLVEPTDTARDTSPDAIDASDTVDEDPIPLVAYTLSEPRKLFFSNNPEQLLTTELGDSDLMDATLLRVTANGPSRSFFEHLNKSGRTIGFGVQVYNPGPNAATLTVSGVGYTIGIDGGTPFAEAFNGEGSLPPKVLAAGQSTWLLRADDTVPNGSFFSGVVDFEVSEPVTVNHIAYDTFSKLDGSTAERDYEQRIEPDGTHEARMYKGVASASEAAFSPVFVFDGATPAGPLQVETRRWDLNLGTFLAPLVESLWISHIGPSQNAASSVTDMVNFRFRSWVFDPLVKSDGEGKYPNLGNWGVVYRFSATLRNEGPNPRRANWRMTASNSTAQLAKTSGGAWTAHTVSPNANLTLATVVVPAFGEATLEGAMVLGGPSGGALRQAVILE